MSCSSGGTRRLAGPGSLDSPGLQLAGQLHVSRSRHHYCVWEFPALSGGYRLYRGGHRLDTGHRPEHRNDLRYRQDEWERYGVSPPARAGCNHRTGEVQQSGGDYGLGDCDQRQGGDIPQSPEVASDTRLIGGIGPLPLEFWAYFVVWLAATCLA